MAIAAIGQICSTASMAHNLEQCVRLATKAAAAGAKVLFLPEASDYIAGSAQESLSLARPVATSPFVTGLREAAKRHGIAVNVGIHVPVSVKPAINAVVPTLPTIATTITAATTEEEGKNPGVLIKLYNRTIWIDEQGDLYEPGTYDKLHLFDYGNLRESAHTQAGAAIVPPFETPVGRVGSLICFDVRFPEPAIRLAHPPAAALQGQEQEGKQEVEGEGKGKKRMFQPAQIITYPSAFTVRTGRAHWEVLLRARAIEAQAYVIAAAQVGAHNERRTSYGHSLAVDPWGKVVCRLGGVREEDGTVDDGAVGVLGLVDVDLAEWERVRREMPLVRRT